METNTNTTTTANAISKEAAGDTKHTPQEVQRAINGFCREIVAAALDNIQNTADLAAFLGALSTIQQSNYHSWIKQEENRLANSLL